ncbi:methylamine utilization protein [Erythrobacter sp. YT30]|uniref:methylamine utilization protein n=1 Tax=Erythrobacter sp. YT30 TaxID=1735012 RepID=UPI000AE045D6|nr:methylamine utilization protein [Erythrobacter sp. YT30]
MIYRFFLALCLFGAATGYGLAASSSGNSLRVQIVDENGVPVRNAVVEVMPARGTPSRIRFPWRMAMAQRNQEFTPGTLIVAKGSTVAFPNLDRVRHSVYSFSKPARFEIDLYGRDQTRSHRFPVAGSVKLGCNIHDNMRGYIRVTETPFAAKTDHNGYATLSDLPTGSAKLTVWHPRLRAPANEKKSALSIASGKRNHKIKVSLR